MQAKGWFAIPGVQEGDRGLEEQMLGITQLLGDARGKSVLDLGCAEGLIAMEFAAAGASPIYGCDCNPRPIATALNVAKRRALVIQFEHINLNQPVMARSGVGPLERYDIVLALAILHKLGQPQAAVEWAAGLARELLVTRLPRKSTGIIASKHRPERTCDVNATLAAQGLRLVFEMPGAHGELVQHWRR